MGCGHPSGERRRALPGWNGQCALIEGHGVGLEAGEVFVAQADRQGPPAIAAIDSHPHPISPHPTLPCTPRRLQEAILWASRGQP